MKGLIKETDQSVPVKDNGYWYYTRYEAGKDYAFNCRKKDSMETGTEEVLVNGPSLAEGHDYWALGGLDVSEDNTILVYSEDVVSRRIYTASFRNIQTGEMLSDKIEGIAGCPVWANDNKTLFYVKKDPTTLREFQIWKHTLGTPQSSDVVVFEEKDEEFSCFVYKTKSKKYMVIGSNQTLSNEYRVLSADVPVGEFKVIQPRERNLEYGIDHYGDRFYITTNLEAKNFRLMSCPETATTKENWQEVIAHRADVLLEGIRKAMRKNIAQPEYVRLVAKRDSAFAGMTAKRKIMSTIEIKVPDIGGFKGVAIIEISVKAGDTVGSGDVLAVIE